MWKVESLEYEDDVKRLSEEIETLRRGRGSAKDQQVQVNLMQPPRILLVDNLECSVKSEVKALRQFMHVCDMIKVGKEDALNTQVDALKMEIKSLKDRESVLQFALKTAEKNNAKVDSGMVAKSAETRKLRLDRIDSELRKQLSDLEQRANNTSHGNIARFEEIKPRRHTEVKIAEKRRQESIDALREALGRFEFDNGEIGQYDTISY